MASFWDQFLRVFWSETFWLPVGSKWKDLENKDDSFFYPQARDICWSVVIGLLFSMFRYCYESLIIVPIGRMLGIKEHKRKAENIPVLQQAFKQSKVPDEETIKSLSKRTDLSVRQIQKWFRVRKNQDTPSVMRKFCECSWHLLFYTLMFLYALVVFWNENWIWETENCWKGWPEHNLTTELYTYYLMELGFYWSLTFSLLLDVKRKDFKEMITHHIATIILLSMSWVLNFVRIGTLTLIVHDIVDPYLASAKMAKYCKKQALCEFLFFSFFIFWIISRLGLYPFWVLRSVLFEIGLHVQPFPSYWVFTFLLCLLQLLHFIWTYMISIIAVQKYTLGELRQDVRSDTESEPDDDADELQSNHIILNNTPKTKRRMVGDHDSKILS